MKNGFDEEWLSMRFEADTKARDMVVDDLLEGLDHGRSISIIDLGAGSGNNAFYLIPHLFRRGINDQKWTLVDIDPDLLDEAMVRLEDMRFNTQDLSIETERVVLDLSGDVEELPVEKTDMVVSSALMDLVSKRWIEEFVKTIYSNGIRYIMISLTFDGRIQWRPSLPLDREVSDIFNRDMKRDKGFGPALGADSVDLLRRDLEGAGYIVRERDTSWRLGPECEELQIRYVDDLARVSRQYSGDGRADRGSIENWRDSRSSLIRSGRSHLLVGHRDLFARRKSDP